MTDTKESQKKYNPHNSGNQKLIVGLISGILLGLLIALFSTNYFPAIGNFLIYFLISLFVIIIFCVLLFTWFKERIFNTIFGKDLNVEDSKGEIRNVYEQVIQQFVSSLLKSFPEDTQIKAKLAVPKLIKVGIWAYTRSWAFTILVSIFVSIGGLLGAILLYNQNQLLTTQNERINIQNTLIEAERRSSLIFLMSNVLDLVDTEINIQRMEVEVSDSTKYSLSKPLVSRIVALSRAFRPYRMMNGDILSEEMVSPERGQLFISLMQNNLDSTTQNTIASEGDFSNAIINQIDLRKANLSEAILSKTDFSGVSPANDIGGRAIFSDANLKHTHFIYANLRAAVFRRADLSWADLSWADLTWAYFEEATLKRAILYNATLINADFRNADLTEADFSYAILMKASLFGANLYKADFRNANLYKADFRNANLYKADFRNANLYKADFRNANLKAIKGITKEQLLEVHSLFGSKNLDPEIEKQLRNEQPCLFTKSGCYN